MAGDVHGGNRPATEVDALACPGQFAVDGARRQAGAVPGGAGHLIVAPLDERGVELVGDDRATQSLAQGVGAAGVVVMTMGDQQRLDRLGADEAIDLGGRAITAIHIPGHSPGSVAYLVSSEGHTVVFAQDVHGPLHPSLLSDEVDYLASLQRLIDLDVDILCEGHYGIFREKPDITRFIRSFMA